MVNLGRVDRDFGPKSTEDAMIEFLDQYFYNTEVDLASAVDVDDWLKNLAFMAVLLHYDSPLGIINNWYLATTNGGDGDWKIVQYDHNNMMGKDLVSLCAPQCAPRAAYWPIMQPTCGPIEKHQLFGRILNTDENMEKYLGYVSEFVDVLTAEDGALSNLYDYGNMIKEYIIDDPLSTLTLEEYEDLELGDDIENYNIEGTLHFLKPTRFRVQQVKEQLDAIQAGTLPLNGEYDPNAVCPDWRNSGTDIPKSGSTYSEDCMLPDCALAGICYDHNPLTCSLEGEILNPDCALASPFCDSCFPHSRCGSATDLDLTGSFVPNNETCGDEFELCELASACFDHGSGRCAFDGSILTVDCQEAVDICEPCFPYSRCGSGDPPAVDDSDPVTSGGGDITTETGAFVPNDDTCGAGFEPCADAGPCFSHDMGLCAPDGSFANELCNDAVFCKGCFPNSRCGGAGVIEMTPDLTVVFTPNDDTCGPEFEECSAAGPCFDHNMGLCGEDGTFNDPLCEAAVGCAPCFPNSRCGTVTADADAMDDPEAEGEESPTGTVEIDVTVLEDDSGGVDRPYAMLSVLSLVVLSLWMVVIA